MIEPQEPQELHEGAPHRSRLDLQSVKRHAKRISQWTDLSLAEGQELTARAYGAKSWQALSRVKTFSSDEDLQATIGKHLEKRREAQLKLLRNRLHIGEALSEYLLDFWQPTAADALACVYEPMATRFNPFATEGVLDLRCLFCLGSHPSIPDECVLAAFRMDKSDSSSAKIEQALELALVREDRLALYVSPEDILLLDPIKHGSPRLASAWTRLKQEPEQKRLGSFEKALAGPGAIRLPPDVAIPNPRAAPIRVTARWLLEPVPRHEVLARLAQWKPWSRDQFPDLSKNKQAFFATTHRDYRFELQALTEIVVLVYELGTRYEHAWVQVGAGDIVYLEPDEEHPRFDVHEPGFYLVKYGNQARGHGPLRGFDERSARVVAEQLGLGAMDSWRPRPVGFFQSDAGLAFAQWLATDSTPGHKLLKMGRAESYLGSWIRPALWRMQWELARAGRL